MNDFEERYRPESTISNVGLYSILVSSIVIFLAGIYVSIRSDIKWNAPGWGDENSPIHLNGIFLIVVGVLASIYPVYQLRKRAKTSKKS